jgi:invasion protein IalB
MNKMTERLVLGAAALVIGLIIGWAVRGVATYNTGTQTVTTYQDWRTACPPAILKDQKCQMMQDVLDSKSGTTVAQIAIGNQNGKDELVVTLPLGLALEPGVGLTLGTDPVRVFPYRTCGQAGCIAVLALDDKTSASLKSSKDGRVLIAGLDGKPVAIPLSLKGYGDATSAWHRNESKRSSWFWRLWS